MRQNPVRSALLILTLSLLATPTADAQRAPADTRAANGEHEILELALRWAFTNHKTDLSTPAAYCVVLVDGDPAVRPSTPVRPTDPPASFLSRFAEQGVPVRPGSECERVIDPRHAILHVPSGRTPALQFTLGTVERTADGGARIGISYVQGGRWGRAWRCTARVEDGQWQLSGCEATWVT